MNLFSPNDHKKLLFFQQKIKNHAKIGNVFLINNSYSKKLLKIFKLFLGCVICDTHALFDCSCRWHKLINKELYPDLISLGNFSDLIKKKDLFFLGQPSRYATYQNKKIFLVIKGVNFLTPPASVLLLKFLEEVSDNWFIVLLATSRNLLATIKSRAFELDFDNNHSPSIINSKETIFKEWKNIIFGRVHGRGLVFRIDKIENWKTSDLIMLMSEVIFYIKKNFLSKFDENIFLETKKCMQQLEIKNINKKIIIYQWISALYYYENY